MFNRLKGKYWGKKIADIGEIRDNKGKRTSVYLWDKDGDLSIQIQSEQFTTAQSGSKHHATIAINGENIAEFEKLIAEAKKQLESSDSGSAS